MDPKSEHAVHGRSRASATTAVLVAALLAAGAAGCRSDSRSDEIADSGAYCVAALVYDGHVYSRQQIRTAVTEGRSLGSGTFPRCNDTPTAGGAPAKEIEIAEIQGVSPSIAVIGRGDAGVVYVRDDVDPHSLPTGIDGLIRPLRCRPEEEPIRFIAELRGIASDDPRRAFRLRAPYDLWVHVRASSTPRYERRFARVRVPVELGTPLTPADVDALWDGTRLSLTIHCLDSGYVADRVALRRS
jgi:hypothetical protein